MSDLEKINKNELEERDPQKEAIEQMNQVAKQVMNNISTDREKSEELYDFMKDLIDIEGDKNPATREAMSKAIEHQMKGTDQMIELLKVKAKLINPNKGTSVNINLGSFDEKKGKNTNDMIEIVENLDFDD